jgi:hypothetical protein
LKPKLNPQIEHLAFETEAKSTKAAAAAAAAAEAAAASKEIISI